MVLKGEGSFFRPFSFIFSILYFLSLPLVSLSKFITATPPPLPSTYTRKLTNPTHHPTDMDIRTDPQKHHHQRPCLTLP